jgi:hypothetical protein
MLYFVHHQLPHVFDRRYIGAVSREVIEDRDPIGSQKIQHNVPTMSTITILLVYKKPRHSSCGDLGELSFPDESYIGARSRWREF